MTDEPGLLSEDLSSIEEVPDERREVWLTDEQRREPRRVPTTQELFDALDRKRAEK